MTRILFNAALGLAGVLALVTIGPPGYAKAAEASLQAPSAETGRPSPQSDMTEMMTRHQQMMAEMKAADAKLDDLVNAMNAATGDGKVTAIAQVVSELVRQQRSMHGHMGRLGNQLMMPMMGGRGMTGGR
jgi:hypothetical protein